MDGSLQDISISLNGEPLPNPTIFAFNQPKGAADISFTKPYATYTEFDLVFNDVDVSTGLNWLRLAATDKVPGVGLTGSAEYSWTVLATSNPLASPALASLDGLDSDASPFDGWIFQFAPVTFLTGSEGGEIHPYYLRFTGPFDVLANLSAAHPEKVAKGPDNNFYAAGPDRTPEARILTALKSARLLPAVSGPFDGFEESAGYFYGIGVQGMDDVKGLFQFAVINAKVTVLEAKYFIAYQHLSLGIANEQDLQFVINLNTKTEQASRAAQAVWDLWSSLERGELASLEAAASGDWPEAWRQSETVRLLAAYMVEAMVAINNEYIESSAFKRGEVKGRITLEAVLIILPVTKAAQVSKVAVLTKLSEVQWIKENPQLLNIILKVIELAKGAKPVPPNIGLVPPGLPPPVAGTEIGGAAERIWGAMTAKMSQGKTLRVAIAEALAEAAANAGDGVVMLRFKELSDLLLARAPGSFATEEEAFAFLSDLLTYTDWQASTSGKGILVVLSDSGNGFFVQAGKAGSFQGNHILKKQLLKTLQDSYDVAVPALDDTPVKIMQRSDHTGTGETSFHQRLNDWNENILSDRNLPNIKDTPSGRYAQAYQVLDEYLRFLKSYPEYADMVPVVRAFSKVHYIPITE